MSQQLKTLADVRRAGIDALQKGLGPVDAVRFLQQFEPGRGDYTANRHKWLGKPTVAAIVEQVRKHRRAAARQ